MRSTPRSSYDETVVVEEAIVGREIEVGGARQPRARGVGARRDRARRGVLQLRGQVRHRWRPTADPGAPRRGGRPPRSARWRCGRSGRCGAKASPASTSSTRWTNRQGRGFLLNEINTMPGFTPISMYPKLWIHSGVPLRRTDRPTRRPRPRTPHPPPPQHHPLTAPILVCVRISEGRPSEILTQTWVGARREVGGRDHVVGRAGGAMILSMSSADTREPDHASARVRSPGDFLRLIVAASAIVIVFLVAWLFGDTVVVFASDFFAGIDAVPDWLLTTADRRHPAAHRSPYWSAACSGPPSARGGRHRSRWCWAA